MRVLTWNLWGRYGPWQEREFQEAQRLQLLAGRERRPRIIPIALTADVRLPAFAALYHHLITTKPDAEEALDSIVAALEHTVSGDPTPDWRHANPYKGLAALTAADAAFFFGREQETTALLERIRQQPEKVLTLVGNSGVGKTSGRPLKAWSSNSPVSHSSRSSIHAFAAASQGHEGAKSQSNIWTTSGRPRSSSFVKDRC